MDGGGRRRRERLSPDSEAAGVKPEAPTLLAERCSTCSATRGSRKEQGSAAGMAPRLRAV